MGCLSATQLSFGGLVALAVTLTTEHATAFLAAPRIAGERMRGCQPEAGLLRRQYSGISSVHFVARTSPLRTTAVDKICSVLKFKDFCIAHINITTTITALIFTSRFVYSGLFLYLILFYVSSPQGTQNCVYLGLFSYFILYVLFISSLPHSSCSIYGHARTLLVATTPRLHSEMGCSMDHTSILIGQHLYAHPVRTGISFGHPAPTQ